MLCIKFGKLIQNFSKIRLWVNKVGRNIYVNFPNFIISHAKLSSFMVVITLDRLLLVQIASTKMVKMPFLRMQVMIILHANAA